MQHFLFQKLKEIVHKVVPFVNCENKNNKESMVWQENQRNAMNNW